MLKNHIWGRQPPENAIYGVFHLIGTVLLVITVPTDKGLNHGMFKTS
jgi:hypothetical protein